MRINPRENVFQKSYEHKNDKYDCDDEKKYDSTTRTHKIKCKIKTTENEKHDETNEAKSEDKIINKTSGLGVNVIRIFFWKHRKNAR